MLCIGGPFHGMDVEFDKANYFYAPILEDRPFRCCTGVPDYTPIKKVTYYKEKLITRGGGIIECWVIE